MREIREAEIQRRLGHATDSSAFEGLSARSQPLLPNHGHRRFFVASESTRDGANGNMVRPSQALNVQIWSSRIVIDPRGVLAEFGLHIPENKEIRVWDSSAELRYLVLPERPAGTEGWSEAQLSELITRDSMIGTGVVSAP